MKNMKQRLWPTKPKIFTIWLLTEKLANPHLESRQAKENMKRVPGITVDARDCLIPKYRLSLPPVTG